jgi:hypothetical protein
MPWFLHTVSHHTLDVFFWEVHYVTLRGRAEVRQRILELGRHGAVTLPVISMTNNAVALIELQAENRIGAREVGAAFLS